RVVLLSNWPSRTSQDLSRAVVQPAALRRMLLARRWRGKSSIGMSRCSSVSENPTIARSGAGAVVVGTRRLGPRFVFGMQAADDDVAVIQHLGRCVLRDVFDQQ